MKKIQVLLQQQFDKMCQTGKLFRVALSGSAIWDLYINSFPKEHNPTFRDPASSEHNCNNCKNFVRRYGNIVAIDPATGNLMSIFGINPDLVEEEYQASLKTMSGAIEKSTIDNVFFETFNELNLLNYEKTNRNQETYRLGIKQNFKRYTQEEADLYGKVNSSDNYEFNHMSLQLPKEYVDFSGNSIESITATYRDKFNVLKRAMEEISIDTLYLVRDLINQGSLLNGDSYTHDLTQIIGVATEYKNQSKKHNFLCDVSYSLPERVAKFRNTLLGTLCVELSQGEDLNKACLNWNKRADPANYMKAIAPITKKQIEEAKKFVEENGYAQSFERRLATMEDIKASEILHMNVGDGKIKTASVFDNVKATATRHKRAEFDKIEEVHIDKFMKDVLPNCSGLELFVENKHLNNFCTLVTAVDPDSKPIFKYSNNYSKTFKGNLAGNSQIKEAVKSQGGKVDGVLRFSIMWAEDNVDNSDLDAHCREPNGNTIFFGHRTSGTGGNLDIDITQPQSHKTTGKDVVENITFPNLGTMIEGTYTFMVNQFSARNSKGFRAEIEFNGELYQYVYNNPVKGTIGVATVTLKGGEFSINHSLPLSSETSKDVDSWGIATNNFHKVNLVCLSPNHWGEKPVGNKHVMFMLENCKTDTPIRGFHNEDLIPELLQHRKVMEVLGATSLIEPTDKQLSGLGFNTTVRDEVVVKCSGNFKRVLKIKF